MIWCSSATSSSIRASRSRRLTRSRAPCAIPETFVVVDGYHAFMAMPVDIGTIAGRVFYMGGGYKYAMTGEGACFLHVPAGYGPRPVNTGWYAAFSALSSGANASVPYGTDGQRFIGSTFDQTALYRFVAVMDWAVDLGLTPRRNPPSADMPCSARSPTPWMTHGCRAWAATRLWCPWTSRTAASFWSIARPDAAGNP